VLGQGECDKSFCSVRKLHSTVNFFYALPDCSSLHFISRISLSNMIFHMLPPNSNNQHRIMELSKVTNRLLCLKYLVQKRALTGFVVDNVSHATSMITNPPIPYLTTSLENIQYVEAWIGKNLAVAQFITTRVQGCTTNGSGVTNIFETASYFLCTD